MRYDLAYSPDPVKTTNRKNARTFEYASAFDHKKTPLREFNKTDKTNAVSNNKRKNLTGGRKRSGCKRNNNT